MLKIDQTIDFAVNRATEDISQLEKKAKQSENPEKMAESAREFEAFFLARIFNQALKAIPKSGFFTGKKEEMFQSMLVDELTKKAVLKGQGIGLAKQIYQESERNSPKMELETKKIQKEV